jgi:hypothetical protein
MAVFAKLGTKCHAALGVVAGHAASADGTCETASVGKRPQLPHFAPTAEIDWLIEGLGHDNHERDT